MIPAHVLQWALLGLALWVAAVAAVLAVMAAARRSDEQSSGEAAPASSGPAPAPVPRTASELVTAACVALRADYGALLGPQRGEQEAGLLTEHGNTRTPAAMANAVTLARTALSVNAPVVAHDD